MLFYILYFIFILYFIGAGNWIQVTLITYYVFKFSVWLKTSIIVYRFCCFCWGRVSLCFTGSSDTCCVAWLSLNFQHPSSLCLLSACDKHVTPCLFMHSLLHESWRKCNCNHCGFEFKFCFRVIRRLLWTGCLCHPRFKCRSPNFRARACEKVSQLS